MTTLGRLIEWLRTREPKRDDAPRIGPNRTAISPSPWAGLLRPKRFSNRRTRCSGLSCAILHEA